VHVILKKEKGMGNFPGKKGGEKENDKREFAPGKLGNESSEPGERVRRKRNWTQRRLWVEVLRKGRKTTRGGTGKYGLRENKHHEQGEGTKKKWTRDGEGDRLFVQKKKKNPRRERKDGREKKMTPDQRRFGKKEGEQLPWVHWKGSLRRKGTPGEGQKKGIKKKRPTLEKTAERKKGKKGNITNSSGGGGVRLQ